VDDRQRGEFDLAVERLLGQKVFMSGEKHITIRSNRPPGRLRRLWAPRAALFALTFRQVRGRFAKPLIGFAWLILQPALQALVFSVFFGFLVRVPSDGTPYPAMVFTGVALWYLVQHSAAEGANAFIGAAPLLRQTPMPRLYPVIAATLSAGVDACIALLVAFFVGLLFGTHPGWPLITAPLFVLAALIAAFGLSSILAALCGVWRDIRQLVPLGLQVLMFASPVIYPASLIPQSWQPFYALNPFSGIISALRWSLLGAPAPDSTNLIISLGSALVLGGFGLWLFFSLEGRAADEL
jgi:homopolymeric O-antigen transport system permease protein